MTFRPKSKSKKEKLMALAFAISAVLLFLISAVSRFAGVLQIIAVIFAVVSIEVYMKYVGSDYIYDAADDYFKVYRVTGNKSVCVSSLDYEMSLSKVISNKEYLDNKSEYPKVSYTVNLAKNIFPKEYHVYFFEFDGKKVMMKFEPDEVFVKYINEIIVNNAVNVE